MMGERPTPWTDWLTARGYAVPEDIRYAYSVRAPGPDYEDGAPVPKPLALPVEADDTSFLVDRCIDYIRSAGRPFVAHLSILRPASALHRARAVQRDVRPDGTCLASSAARRPKTKQRSIPGLAHQLSRRLFRAPPDGKKLRRLKAVYYGLMSEVDAAIGRVIACLKETGRWDNTLIVFTSDHGEQMGDHWLLGKCGYFDAVLPHPVDRARSAPLRGAREPGGKLHRERRHHADDAGRARPRYPGAMRRPFVAAVPGAHRVRPPIGAARRTGNTISAIQPTTRSSGAWA